MRRKHLYLTLSILLAFSILLIILFVSGVLPAKAPVTGSNDYSENALNDDTKVEDRSELASGKDSLLESNIQEEIDNQWISQKSISIVNNSPEYEVEMYLCYDNDKIPFIEIEYYIEGASKSCLYSASEIPALKEFAGGDNKKLRINEGVMNTKYAKLYFFVEKELSSHEILFDFYVLNLKDEKIKKLHNGKGYNFNELIFSPDKEYVTFSYLAANMGDADDTDNTDNTADIGYSDNISDKIDKVNIAYASDAGKDSFIQIFNCITDNILVAHNKTPEGKTIGKAAANNRFYSYSIVRWKSSEELRLKEYSYLWNKEKPAKEDESEIDVIFSVVENHVIYPEEKSRIESEAGLAYILDSDKQDKDKQEDSQQDDSQEKDILNEDGQQEDNQAQSGEQDMAVGNDRSKNGEQEQKIGQEQEMQQTEGTSGSGNEQASSASEDSETKGHDKGTGGSEDGDSEPIPEDSTVEDGLPNDESKDSTTNESVPADSSDSSKDGDGEIGKTSSEAVTVLKKFYEYINDSAYEKAYDLLDEKVKFNAFKKIFAQLFGEVEVNIEINKADIDIEYFALFMETTGMFKNDEIDKIVLEEINNNVSKIYYYHTMIIAANGTDQETTMPMVATLNKTAKGWKIAAFDDGDANARPFK
jgi:hypothetical protein